MPQGSRRMEIRRRTGRKNKGQAVGYGCIRQPFSMLPIYPASLSAEAFAGNKMHVKKRAVVKFS